jgi:hypothetical protein
MLDSMARKERVKCLYRIKFIDVKIYALATLSALRRPLGSLHDQRAFRRSTPCTTCKSSAYRRPPFPPLKFAYPTPNAPAAAGHLCKSGALQALFGSLFHVHGEVV